MMVITKTAAMKPARTKAMAGILTEPPLFERKIKDTGFLCSCA